MNPASYEELLAAIDAAAAKSPGGMLAILLAEITDFPGLQASQGFAESAAMLTRMAEQFIPAMSARGEVRRFGDGRFCVLVNGLRNPGHAALAAEKLVRVVDEMMKEVELGVKPQLHVGIALNPQHGQVAHELLRKAQLAMLAARKRSLRTVTFSDEHAEQVMKPWALQEAFAKALDSGGLSVYYQPKVSIADGRPSGAEALMRWMKDGKPVATPDVFIPLAEEAGLIHNTTWYALSAALREASEWPARNMGVAVNITPGMMYHREFLDMVRSAISTWKLPEGGLTLEITEGALVSDLSSSVKRLEQLRDLGVRISIDDFGTGYSSLSYFKKIPAQELKIDKSFVMGMLKDPADERLVGTIMALAQQFKLQVVAEGVEDEATLNRLREMGCDYAQGYFYAPALGQEKFCAWVCERMAAFNTMALQRSSPPL